MTLTDIYRLKDWHWPYLRRNFGGFPEFACPHGIGHGGTHGCDGCCQHPSYNQVTSTAWLDVIWKGELRKINSKGKLMPKYQAYPTTTDTPNRKHRKAKRRTVFAHNKAQANVERKERREGRKKNA